MIIASPLLIAAVALGALGAILIIAGIAALLRLRPLGFVLRVLAGLTLMSLGALAGAIAIGMQGYRAFTREDIAARIRVQPIAPQRFSATFRFADGREATYELAGDEIYVDAHILKWHPRANLVGLHTGYELDRVTGRYHGIKDERAAPRTVHSLATARPVDLFALRRRYAFLAPLVDAQYGSATFVPVTQPAEYELRVSTTGLLIRESKGAAS